MEAQELLKFFLKKGFLVDKDILNLLSETEDEETVKLIVERVGIQTNRKIITKNVLKENREKVNEVFSTLPIKNPRRIEKLKIRLGLNIQISKEISNEVSANIKDEKEKIDPLNQGNSVRVITSPPVLGKKLSVEDFVMHFRGRFNDMKNILQDIPELENLTSINKISNTRQNFSLIGIISDKRVTKNKNLLFEVEDLTGKIRVLINQNKPELYEKAEEVTLDAIIGIKGSGNREFFFANDIIFPDSYLAERKNSPYDEYVLFLGDLHFGSNKFLGDGFNRFLDYLNGKVPNTPEVDKIKYLFITGDLVTGVGNYPNQEKDLKINDLEEQYLGLAELFKKIPERIKIIVCAGNHDGVRLMEPQPLLNEKFAWPLYDLPNLVFTSNPAEVSIGAQGNFSGFNVLTYHGFSFPYYANEIPYLAKKKAMNSPDDIMKFLLRNKHLAPSHSSVQYFPMERDPLMIRNVPDVFVCGHTHKCAVSYYNNVLIISVACWESLTPYQEKFGNQPDHCKVPMFNLKTRAIKILDFE